jgi:hypothetical protein
MKLVGLSGRAGAGKTKVAEHLVEHFGYTRTAFGDPLKQMLITAGLCTWEECYVEKTPRSRELLQKIGTEIFRKQVDPKFWVRKTAEIVHKLLANGYRVVIDDIRFPEEAQMVQAFLREGVLIKLEREGHVDATAGATHESESLVDTIPADHVVRAGSGEVEKLLLCVEEIIGEHAGRA